MALKEFLKVEKISKNFERFSVSDTTNFGRPLLRWKFETSEIFVNECAFALCFKEASFQLDFGKKLSPRKSPNRVTGAYKREALKLSLMVDDKKLRINYFLSH